MTPLIVGIDPGQRGAIAVLNADGECELADDLPIIRDGRLAWVDGGRLQSMLIDTARGRSARAIVERVGAMPRQGIASAFTFGVTFGSILSVLQARHISIELVTAAVWKRSLGLSSDKRASLDKARLLYPAVDLSLAKHEGRAEALLLAQYGLRARASLEAA